MSDNKKYNLQDLFLNDIKTEQIDTTIFLSNGIKLQGKITWFDDLSILLCRDDHSQLVYKHSIATVLPLTPVNASNID